MNDLKFCWTKHDECEHMIPNETRFQLTNNGTDQIWHCNCDIEFYQCLHRIDTFISNHIGKLYFSAQKRCFRQEYRILKCIEYDQHYSSETNKRCVRYLLLLNTPLQRQWFDLPFYTGKPAKSPIFTTEK